MSTRNEPPVDAATAPPQKWLDSVTETWATPRAALGEQLIRNVLDIWADEDVGAALRAVVLTAAHKTLAFGTLVEVTNQRNGRAIVVRINDRGPFIAGRVIDLTPAGARALKFDGVTPVAVRVLNHRRDAHLAERAI